MNNLQFYVNIYKSKAGNYFCFGNFKSIESAENSAKKYTYAGSTYIKTKLAIIDWE